MEKAPLKDVIIILPGITGSVLEKDGKVIWEASYKAIFRALATGSFQQLKLEQDSLEDDDLGDGIRATKVAEDFHLLPGICKIDGYTGLRQMIFREFNVKKGSLDNLEPANYFEFPYDWRRDNRYSAKKLKELIDERLWIWRNHTGLKEAKVILIGHSMGGIISRYYLEALEGWRNCKALITFGTPHRGSVDAVESIVNGVKKVGVDLSEVMRSFTSVYQLLPIYPVLNNGQGFVRLNESEGLPNLSAAKAAEGISFLREIEKKVNGHRKNDNNYLTNGYQIIPVVGTHQKTKQSVSIDGQGVRASYEPPIVVPTFLADGDGTVPRVSAIPIELSAEYRETYISDKHASLQNNRQLLGRMKDRLITMQDPIILANIRGSATQPERSPAFSLEVDEVFNTNDSVTIQASLYNMEESKGIIARVKSLESAKLVSEVEMELSTTERVYFGEFGCLSAGAYRVELSLPEQPNLDPISDVFLVI